MIFCFSIASEHGCRASVRHRSLRTFVLEIVFTGMPGLVHSFDTDLSKPNSGSEDLAQSETSREALG